MGFDAGAITAHLKLDREEFDEDLDDVKKRGQELDDTVWSPKVKLDLEEFDEDVDEVDEKKDELEKPVEFEVSVDKDKLDEEVDEVKGKKDELEKPVDIPIGASSESFDEKAAELEESKSALESPVEIPAELETSTVDRDAAEIEGVKEALESPVKIPAEFDQPALAVEGEAAHETAKLTAGEPIEIPLNLNLAELYIEAAAAKAFLAGVFGDSELGAARTNILSSILGQGLNLSELNDVMGFAGFPPAQIDQVSRALEAAAAPPAIPPASIVDAFAQEVPPGAASSFLPPTPALGVGSDLEEQLAEEERLGYESAVRQAEAQATNLINSLYGSNGLRNSSFGEGWFGSAEDQAPPPPNPAAKAIDQLAADNLHAAAIARAENLAEKVAANEADSSFLNDFTNGLPGAASIGSDGSVIFRAFGGSGGAVKSDAEQFAEMWKADAKAALTDGEYEVFGQFGAQGKTNPLSALFKGRSQIESDLKKWASKAGKEVSGSFTSALSKGIISDAESALGGGSGGGFFGKLLTGAVSGAGSFVDSLGNLSPALQFGVPLASLAVPVLGAVGLATGGAIAGTSIGLAGTAAAFIPGLLDLVKGYEAYSGAKTAASTYQSTVSSDAAAVAAGLMTPAQAATANETAKITEQQTLASYTPQANSIAAAIAPIVSSGSSYLGKAEQEIDPQIITFLHSLGDALHYVAPFGEAAIKSMSGFFDSIDRGLQSGGFRSFMATMTKDVGPVMDEFGHFLINMGNAFGGFLKLFGGAPAQAVGKWFDRVSGGLATFLNHVKLGPGFMQGMTTAFGFLGAAGDLVWHVLVDLFKALAPIGLTIMKVLTPAFQGLTGLIQKIPIGDLTAALAILGGVLGGLALEASPFLAIPAAILAIGWAYEKIQGLLHPPQLPALTPAQQFLGAYGANLPANQRTLAENEAIAAAAYRGVPIPQQAALAPYLNPSNPVSPTGRSKLGDLQDTGIIGNTPADQRLRALQQANYKENTPLPPKPPPGWLQELQHISKAFFDVGHAADIAARDFGGFLNRGSQDLANWTHDLEHWLGEGAKDIGNWATNSLPHGFDTARHAIAHGFDDITGGVSNWVTNSLPHTFDLVRHGIADWFTNSLPHGFDTARHAIASGFDLVTSSVSNWVSNSLPHTFDLVRSGIANWVTNSLPHGFDNVRHVIASAFDSFTGAIDTFVTQKLPHAFDGVVSGITHWVTSSLPNAFSGMARAVQGAFAGAGSWLAGVGEKIIDGLIGPLNSAINFANAHDPSFLGIHLFPHIPNIPSFDTGGWVGGPEGAPSLAIVHGGEFVMSSAMVAASGGGAGTHIEVNVDARGSSDPWAVQQAAQKGVASVIPDLRRALQRAPTGPMAA
jgi:hypothetical protein